MPKGFVVNAHRVDPYKNFKFRVQWDGRVVLGVSKVSPLKRTTEVVPHRDGGDNSSDLKSPGRTSYEAVTMERGITHDLEFEAWANLVHPYDGDPVKDLVNYKKPLTLEVLNERGVEPLRICGQRLNNPGPDARIPRPDLPRLHLVGRLDVVIRPTVERPDERHLVDLLGRCGEISDTSIGWGAGSRHRPRNPEHADHREPLHRAHSHASLHRIAPSSVLPDTARFA